MGINVHGDTAEVVDQVSIQPVALNEDGGWMLGIFGCAAAASADGGEVSPGYLLVVISMFRRDQIRNLQIGSDASSLGCKIVFGDRVLRVRDDNPRIISNTSGNLEYESASGSSSYDVKANSFVGMISGYTTTYFLSSSTVLDLDMFTAAIEEKASLYMDVSSIVTSARTKLSTGYGSTIIAVAGTTNTTILDLKSSFSPGLCLYLMDSLEVGKVKLNDDEMFIAMPGKTADIKVDGTYTCGKAVIPERVPRDITLTTTRFTASDEILTVSSSSPSSSPVVSSGSAVSGASSVRSSVVSMRTTVSLLVGLAGSLLH